MRALVGLGLIARTGAVVWAQSGLEHPRLGMMLDTTAQVRPVSGVAGSVTLGDPVASDVISSGCARDICLFKTRSAILFGTIETAAPSGPALFAFEAHTAFVYFPFSRQLARQNEEGFDSVPVDITGEVLSVRVRTNGDPEFAVRRDGGTWIVQANNQPSDSIPVTSGPVMLVRDGALYASLSEVILRRTDASELHFSIPGAQSFSALGDGYVQIRAGQLNFALCAVVGRERIFMLPEPPR